MLEIPAVIDSPKSALVACHATDQPWSVPRNKTRGSVAVIKDVQCVADNLEQKTYLNQGQKFQESTVVDTVNNSHMHFTRGYKFSCDTNGDQSS